MLYYINNLPITKIQTYHRTEKYPEIRSTNTYKFLRADIEKNGFRDPIFIRNTKGILQVHVGEQRLLIANELGVKTLRSFVYNKYDGKPTEVIKNADEAKKHFQDITVPTCDCICRYIKHGQINLQGFQDG